MKAITKDQAGLQGVDDEGIRQLVLHHDVPIGVRRQAWDDRVRRCVEGCFDNAADTVTGAVGEVDVEAISGRVVVGWSLRVLLVLGDVGAAFASLVSLLKT